MINSHKELVQEIKVFTNKFDLIDSFIFFLMPDFGITFSEFTFLGELLITFWLLIKGVNVDVWEKRALESV